ncbi:hypothetical protein ANCCEY_07280 [Ancylostoma ceylanicum]|uniref:Uncharacterized protein n=1 Tax=Ancylostoma ceylanicum TaxID=53326 RepID=A0A0D6LP13_9BILA|nr:hypothetical protein ANCCEY_07280 [Ancylostoma ceylanicum]
MAKEKYSQLRRKDSLLPLIYDNLLQQKTCKCPRVLGGPLCNELPSGTAIGCNGTVEEHQSRKDSSY